MATVKERLEAKRRNRTSVLVQVEDPRAAANALDTAKSRLALAMSEDTASKDFTALETAVEETAAAWRACHVEVEFQSLQADEYEAITARCRKGDGDLDSVAVTPLLAAACAVDEELQDVDWWTAQLASESWSAGERVDLFSALIQVNTPDLFRGLPKG